MKSLIFILSLSLLLQTQQSIAMNTPQSTTETSTSSSSYEIDKESICCICRNKLVDLEAQGKLLLQAQCKHIYCSDCLELLFQSKPNGIECPICRKYIASINATTIALLPQNMPLTVTPQEQIQQLKKNMYLMLQRIKNLENITPQQNTLNHHWDNNFLYNNRKLIFIIIVAAMITAGILNYPLTLSVLKAIGWFCACILGIILFQEAPDFREKMKALMISGIIAVNIYIVARMFQ